MVGQWLSISCTTISAAFTGTLRVTPEMQAGIADHVWSIKGMVSVIRGHSLASRATDQPYLAGRRSDGVRATMTEIATKELLAVVSLPQLDLLHYLLSESNGKHIAHCLDLDLVATADHRKNAAQKLHRLVKATIELALATQQFASLATRAPQNFWNEFATGNTIELEPKTLQIKIPESVQIVPVSDSILPILARASHAS
jgi:hypothetical protein